MSGGVVLFVVPFFLSVTSFSATWFVRLVRLRWGVSLCWCSRLCGHELAGKRTDGRAAEVRGVGDEEILLEVSCLRRDKSGDVQQSVYWRRVRTKYQR
jgi:hypothetical protein